MPKRKVIYLVIIAVAVVIGVKAVVDNYYEITGPVFPEHHFYRATDRGATDIKLYYFTNAESKWSVTEIKQPAGSMVEFKLVGTSVEGYSQYHDRHVVSLEATALEPGRYEFDELTFVFNGSLEQTVTIGSLIFDFREPSGKAGKYQVLATGSSSNNRDFTYYQAEEPLTLKRIQYQLPDELDGVLKVVAYPEAADIAGDERNYSKILKADLTQEPQLQNRDLSIRLDRDEALILTSYFDFTAQGLAEFADWTQISVDSEVVFVDGAGQETVISYHSEYVPYLESGDIRALARLKQYFK